ncbi:hypothetical protein, partial [Marinobacter sp. UBA2498]|uniref:hypothetical protein n=1 Tax=Marinobacter sp. UBA2498 TaxID=1946813 RepID=UPI00257F5309
RPRILHRNAALSTVNPKNFKTHFLQYFQTVTSARKTAVSGLSLRSGAHSTGVRKTVNEVFELIYSGIGFHVSA